MDRPFKYKRGDILEQWDMNGDDHQITYFIVVKTAVERARWKPSRKYLRSHWDKVYYVTTVTDMSDPPNHEYATAYDIEAIEGPTLLLPNSSPPRYYGWRKVGDLFHAQAI